MSVTTKDLLDLHSRLCDEGKELMQRKNADY